MMHIVSCLHLKEDRGRNSLSHMFFISLFLEDRSIFVTGNCYWVIKLSHFNNSMDKLYIAIIWITYNIHADKIFYVTNNLMRKRK